jgi:hypothetical protein
MPPETLLASVLALVVVGGATVLIARWGVKAGQDAAEGNDTRAILLTGGFRTIAARMGLEDPWPGRRADDVPAAGPHRIAFGYPALRGTYRNRRINVTVCGFANDGEGYDSSYFDIIVRARRGSRWRKRRRLDWGKPPAELSPPALLALQRLKERKKRGRMIVSIGVDAEELSCVTRDDITGAVSLHEARTDTALPEPTELEAILDDLVTLADGLPVVDAPGDRLQSRDARGPDSRNL